MRTATLLLLAAVAASDEPQAKGPPKMRVSRAEWDRLVTDVRARDDTTIAKLASLKALALNHEVVERAKIVDVCPSANGEVELVTWNIDTREPDQGFMVVGPEAKLASDWKKWDRVSWISDPEVVTVESIELKPRYSSLADLSRTPSPGLQFPSFERAPYDEAKFHARFADVLGYAKEGAAYSASSAQECLRMLEKARGKAFVRKGKVLDDGSLSVDGEQLRPWKGEDPELLAALRPGVNVEVWIVVKSDVTNTRELLAAEKPYAVEWCLAKIEAAAAEKPAKKSPG